VVSQDEDENWDEIRDAAAFSASAIAAAAPADINSVQPTSTTIDNSVLPLVGTATDTTESVGTAMVNSPAVISVSTTSSMVKETITVGPVERFSTNPPSNSFTVIPAPVSETKPELQTTPAPRQTPPSSITRDQPIDSVERTPAVVSERFEQVDDVRETASAAAEKSPATSAFTRIEEKSTSEDKRALAKSNVLGSSEEDERSLASPELITIVPGAPEGVRSSESGQSSAQSLGGWSAVSKQSGDDEMLRTTEVHGGSLVVIGPPLSDRTTPSDTKGLIFSALLFVLSFNLLIL